MILTFKHAPKLKATLAFGFALSALAFSSCQDEDFGYTSDQVAYQTNFEKTYGKISKDQTWDLSSYNLKKLGLVGGPSNDFAAIGGAGTRAIEASSSEVDAMRNVLGTWYDVKTSTTKWLNNNLQEKHNNKDKGSAFTLINPFYEIYDNSEVLNPSSVDFSKGQFLIIPIYQGASGMTWDLHLVDDQNDYNIWSKSENMRFTTDYTLWEEFLYRGGLSKDGSDSYNVITLKDAFPGKNLSISGNKVYMHIELADEDRAIDLLEGKVKGEFYVTDGSKKGLVTDVKYLNGTAFNADRENLDEFAGSGRTNGEIANERILDLTDILGKTYNGIAVADDLSNLIFKAESLINCELNSYFPDRIRFFVKLTDNSFIASDPTPLNNMNGQNSVAYFEGHTIEKNHIQSKAMLIDGSKLGREFSLYLQTTFTDVNNIEYSQLNTKHRSNGDPHMMIALHDMTAMAGLIDVNETLNQVLGTSGQTYNYEYMVIGCEDANGRLSDKDYNDVVLLFVGLPRVPKIATEVCQKRYMIEDLGSTFDFDFNDIVVDVTDEKIVQMGDKNADPIHKQIVSIAHLCGTIPFQVKIGDVLLPQMEGKNGDGEEYGSGFDPRSDENYITKYVFEFPNSTTRTLPWDKDENNIVIYVWPNAKTLSGATGDGVGSVYDGENNLLDIKDAQQITFPKKGQFPYIIAVDQDINWMPELISVPESWFKVAAGGDDILNGNNSYNGNNNPNPQKPSDTTIDQTTNNSGYGYLVGESVMDNTDGSTTKINLGSFLQDEDHKYYNPGRNLTLTIALPASVLDLPGNSAATPAVKGMFKKSGSTTQIEDAVVDLMKFDYPRNNNGEITNSNIIIQQFTFANANMLSLDNIKDLIFEVTYATYGFKDVGTNNSGNSNPKARLFVKWDERPMLQITPTDPNEELPITVKYSGGSNISKSNGVYYVNANSTITIAGNNNCNRSFRWSKSDGTFIEETVTTAQKTISFGKEDVELSVEVYYALRPQMQQYSGTGDINDDGNYVKNSSGNIQTLSISTVGNITLQWKSEQGGDNRTATGGNPIYVPRGAKVTSTVTISDESKYEFAGWRWQGEHKDDNPLLYTRNNQRGIEYNPHAAIIVKDESKHKLTFHVASSDAGDIQKIWVNGEELTVTDNTASIYLAEGDPIKVQILHKALTANYTKNNVQYKLTDAGGSAVTSTTIWNNVLPDGQTELEVFDTGKTMGDEDMTWTVSCLYQVIAYVKDAPNGTWGNVNANGNKITISDGVNTSTNGGMYVAKNANLTFTANPAAGYRLEGWYPIANSPSSLGTGNTFSPSRTSPAYNYSVSGVFQPNVLSFVLSDTDKGDVYSIRVNGDEKLVNNNNTISFNVSPGTGITTVIYYRETNPSTWDAVYDLAPTDGSTSYNKNSGANISMGTMPSANRTYNVTSKYQVIAAINGEWGDSNAGSISNRQQFLTKNGTAQALTATANTGYYFKGWYEGSTQKSTSNTWTPTHTKEYYFNARFGVIINTNSSDYGGRQCRLSVSGSDGWQNPGAYTKICNVLTKSSNHMHFEFTSGTTGTIEIQTFDKDSEGNDSYKNLAGYSSTSISNGTLDVYLSEAAISQIKGLSSNGALLIRMSAEQNLNLNRLTVE